MNRLRPNLRIEETAESYCLSGPCSVTGEVYEATYPKGGIDKWLNGTFIQDAMPAVDAGDREFLISGISPAGWDRLFERSGQSNE
jgi:hypothetical protein